MIKHVLADGSRLNTLEGYNVPYNRTTDVAYRLLAEVLRGGGQHEQQGMEQNSGMQLSRVRVQAII